MNIEYRGGFHLSVDVTAVLGRKAFLSVKVSRVAGQVRLRFSRRPYTHWSFGFTHEPTVSQDIPALSVTILLLLDGY